MSDDQDDLTDRWRRVVSPRVDEVMKKLGGTIVTPEKFSEVVRTIQSLSIEDQVEFLLLQLALKF